MEAAVAETQGMSPYEAARERNLQENKRKMEALNLRHLSAVIKEAPKTPSPMVRCHVRCCLLRSFVSLHLL
jgi:hypothetical protein